MLKTTLAQNNICSKQHLLKTIYAQNAICSKQHLLKTTLAQNNIFWKQHFQDFHLLFRIFTFSSGFSPSFYDSQHWHNIDEILAQLSYNFGTTMTQQLHIYNICTTLEQHWHKISKNLLNNCTLLAQPWHIVSTILF